MWKAEVWFNFNKGIKKEDLWITPDASHKSSNKIHISGSIGYGLQWLLHAEGYEQDILFLESIGISNIDFDLIRTKLEFSKLLEDFSNGKYHQKGYSHYTPDLGVPNCFVKYEKEPLYEELQQQRFEENKLKMYEVFNKINTFIDSEENDEADESNEIEVPDKYSNDAFGNFNRYSKKVSLELGRASGNVRVFHVASFIDLLKVEFGECMVNKVYPIKCKNCPAYFFGYKRNDTQYCEGCKSSGYPSRIPISKLTGTTQEKEALKRLFRTNKSRYKWTIDDAIGYLKKKNLESFVDSIDKLWPTRKYRKKKSFHK